MELSTFDLIKNQSFEAVQYKLKGVAVDFFQIILLLFASSADPDGSCNLDLKCLQMPHLRTSYLWSCCGPIVKQSNIYHLSYTKTLLDLPVILLAQDHDLVTVIPLLFSLQTPDVLLQHPLALALTHLSVNLMQQFTSI